MKTKALMDEIGTLSSDIGALAALRQESASTNPAVLRMCAGKARHAGDVLDRLADEVEEQIEEVS
jgi:hypothetical protein